MQGMRLPNSHASGLSSRLRDLVPVGVSVSGSLLCSPESFGGVVCFLRTYAAGGGSW